MEKTTTCTSFIAVCFATITLVIVLTGSRYVTSGSRSMYILGLIQRKSMQLAEADPIEI